jgi:hypothetical protein
MRSGGMKQNIQSTFAFWLYVTPHIFTYTETPAVSDASETVGTPSLHFSFFMLNDGGR